MSKGGDVPQKESSYGVLGLLFGACGIYAAFLYYGDLQEQVFAYKDKNGVKFTHAWFLQTLEALANVVIGFIGMLAMGRTAGLPMRWYGVSGATQVAAKACTSLALANQLSFPVATLAKSAKMAPVMLGSILLGGKSYPLRQYLQVIAIIAGTVMVSMKKGKGGEASSTLGVVFIVSSLALDGVTGGVQDRLKKECSAKGVKAKPYDNMFWTNFFMLLVAIAVSLGLGEMKPGLDYIMANPEILQSIAIFSACSAFGQSFIFFVISEYGPLKVSTVTTTRKIFSVLISIFKYGKEVSPLGWAGIGLGFLGIAGELIPEKKAVKPDDKKKQ